MNNNVFFIGLAMANRSRHCDELSDISSNIFKQYKHGILIFAESDQTEIEQGFDGRKPISMTIEKSKRDDLKTIASPDKEIGVNILYTDSITPEGFHWDWINKYNLEHPMGSSERYKQHRIVSSFKPNKELEDILKVKRIHVLGQHQTAFMHAISRYHQADEAMQILYDLDKNDDVDSLCFIARDQNTWMPFERYAERKLREKYHLTFPTDVLGITYHPENVEDDSGGLNALGAIIMKSFLSSLIKKLFLYQAIETIGLPIYQSELYDIDIKSEIQGQMDHPISYILLNKKTN